MFIDESYEFQRTDARENTFLTYPYKNDGCGLDEMKTSKKREAFNSIQPSASSFGMVLS